MMIRAKNSNTLLLFTFITLFCFYPRLCTSQENNNNATRNACHSFATCGAFGSCNSQSSPICSCLKGFEPENKQEWDSGNWTSGCVRRVPLNCHVNNSNGSREEEEEEDGFLEIQRIKVPGYATRWFGPKSECPGLCLMNCSCIAYAHDSLLGCVFWNSTLLDIEKFPTGLGSDLYFRVANSEIDHKKKDYKKIILALVTIGLVLISICGYFSCKWVAKRKGKRREILLDVSSSFDSSLQDELSKLNLEEFPLFKFEILANATGGFSNASKLGKGGFGVVFKGELANGREIAVKRLSRASGQGLHEFMNEVVLISKLQHRNLVRLIGCCVENNEKMLIYEYMPNKSLDFFLFDQSQEILDWRKRFNIVEGICRGLLYLHRDSRLKIIHRDLKPSNILLDNDWNPKISDFGMARIFGSKQDHISTVKVVGTYGYMAPEYAIEGKFSEKSDVFSFGVMMLEIVCGRKNTGFYNHPSSVNLLGHVWKLWDEGNIAASIDLRISSSSKRTEIVRCIHIGLLCVQELPKDRPSISSVLSMLNSEIAELAKPKQIAFALKSSRPDPGGASSSQQSQKSSGSLNNVTLSIVDGR
ncbi:g-type lectin s-receptor-like serine/threonine-protein kinase at1g11330 [Phtheirospermum japonicum]|uniref:non-specific serine/threonine protein kinase n=1 Tax=Phtheirospermum japonicum TaxID=374723 RepID=A0A830B157_9LAMI|nr:g-type lectin s-receptor-like serine/threonine-protein kinase at1g11330 [Phtheirospermum japonicum]